MARKKTEDGMIVTTFEIAAELKAITKKIISQEGELKDGDFEALQAWNAALEIKAENIGHLKERMEREADYYKLIEEKARSRRKANENTVDRLRKYLAVCMAETGIKSIKKDDGLFSISLCDGKAGVKIDDPNQLPLDLVEIVEVVKPRTAEIKAALDSGKDVPGAHIETSEPFVVIR